jgi:phage FluMu gp28-like protein
MESEFTERSEEIRRAETAAFLEDHLGPVLAGLDQKLATCFGEDFGRLGDLTVIWPMQIMRDLHRRTPFVVELRNIPFRQQEQILFYIADRLPRFIGGAMDARGNGQYLAETARQRYGARIAQVMLSTEWYREQMPRFKAAFEDGTIAIPRDADILLDHRALVLEHGIAQVGERRMRGSDRKQRHGDSAIAAALAYFASRRDVPEIDYRSVSWPTSGRRDPWGPPPDEDSIFANDGRLRFGEGAW